MNPVFMPSAPSSVRSDFGLERDLAVLDRLEHDIGRHDLGQRRRMPRQIDVMRIEHLVGRRLIEQQRLRLGASGRGQRGKHERQQNCDVRQGAHEKPRRSITVQ
jgi:hypothetical protein